jgi:3-oxoacyl-[acyl-carrier protein] reductase
VQRELEGRHALGAGGSQGIGLAAAEAIGAMGASVTLVARNPERLSAARERVLAAGAPAAFMLQADLDDRAALAEAVVNHLDRHGPVQVLVNNTGGPASGRLLDATEEEMVAAFGRHIGSAQLLVQHCLPGMQEARWGRIVNVISTSVREPIPGLGISNIVRAGMASWAKTLSRELPPGITINSVLPGYTDTERLNVLKEQMAKRGGTSADDVARRWIEATPEGRLGQPQELGAAIAFLCSPRASFIRGIVMPVDGGRLMSI